MIQNMFRVCLLWDSQWGLGILEVHNRLERIAHMMQPNTQNGGSEERVALQVGARTHPHGTGDIAAKSRGFRMSSTSRENGISGARNSICHDPGHSTYREQQMFCFQLNGRLW